MNYRLPAMLTMFLLALLVADGYAQAQQGHGFGKGRGPGRGGANDQRRADDQADFQYLLTNHEKINRSVTELSNGVETLTESDDPKVAAKIKEHVKWMKVRVDKNQPIRMRDPLFAELFRNADKIDMKYEETDKGVRTTEISDDPKVATLIKAHAKVVSGFVERGFDEAMKNHEVPNATSDSKKHEYSNPAIKKFGKVVQLPNAGQQPRDGSKIVVDITKGSTPDKLNPAIEKVARFVNIYRGAGKEPAKVDIAIVLHGEATLSVLNADVYSKRFKTKGNPNLDCLHELHEAGVQIFVCGQSLIGEDAKPNEVVVFTDVAVSALTSLVNLQADGYSFVPLGK